MLRWRPELARCGSGDEMPDPRDGIRYDEKRGLALARHCGHGGDPGRLGQPSRRADAAGHSIENVTEKAGLTTRLDQNPTPDKHMVETMAGGLAVFDYDGDGLPRHLLHQRRDAAIASKSIAGSIGTGCSETSAT